MRDQELVNALREHADWWENGDMMNPLGGLEKDLFAAADQLENQNGNIAALQKEIENLRRQVPRWIPVMERRPEQDGKYLCVYSFRTMDDSPARMSFPSVLDYYATDPVPHFQHEGVNEMHVTHWMPLPLPIPMEPIYG